MKPQPSFYESVHLLRGISALLVFWGHNTGWYSLPLLDPLIKSIGGDIARLGVYIFFVISGFVLPLSLEKSYHIRRFHRFIARRFVRIEPTYIFAALVSLAIWMIKTRIAPNAIPKEFNLFEFLAHFLYLIPFTEYEWYNEVFWTLAVEFQFYLLIGLIFPLLRRNIWLTLVLLTGFSLTVFLPPGGPIELLEYSPFFAIGIAGFLLRHFHATNDQALLWFSIVFFSGIYCVHEYSLQGITGVISVCLITGWKPSRHRFRYFGDISYSLYVTHYPIIFFNNQASRFLFGEGPHLFHYVVFFGNFILCVIVAHFVYKWIESPTLLLSKKIQYREEASG